MSLTNNIAEGHGRYHYLDQIKFLLQSRGSLEEILDDLNTCEDEKYLALATLEVLKQEGWRVHKLMNGYIRYLRARAGDQSPRFQEIPDNGVTADELDDIIRFSPSTL